MQEDRGHEYHGTGKENWEEKNLAAQIRSTLKRVVQLCLVPLTKVYSQGNYRNSDRKQIKTETMDHDQLVEELKWCLVEKW
jgi:hypothetical protein